LRRRWVDRLDDGYVGYGGRRVVEVAVERIGSVVVVIWLVIGVIAAVQRDYFSGSDANCAKLGNIAVTIIAGPLNYAGVNPKITCKVPQPSK
jgi:hypothetical protein